MNSQRFVIFRVVHELGRPAESRRPLTVSKLSISPSTLSLSLSLSFFSDARACALAVKLTRSLARTRVHPPAAFERRFKIHLVSVTRDGLRHGLFFARPPLGRGNSNYRPLFPHWKHIPPGSQYPRLADALWLLISRFVFSLSLSLSASPFYFLRGYRIINVTNFGNCKVEVEALIFTTKLREGSSLFFHKRLKCQSEIEMEERERGRKRRRREKKIVENYFGR